MNQLKILASDLREYTTHEQKVNSFIEETSKNFSIEKIENHIVQPSHAVGMSVMGGRSLAYNPDIVTIITYSKK